MTGDASEIDVGHAVFALHQPHRGYERDFNRWYERDHMYIGGVLAPWTIGASRWVAPASLKAHRFGAGAFGPIADGDFLATYWIAQGRIGDQQKWVAEQLPGAPTFEHKTVQTATAYDRVDAWRRDPDGVPVFLALAHGYPAVAWLVLQRSPDVELTALSTWLFGDYAKRRWAGSPVASAVAFSPRPKEPWWPPAAPDVVGVGDRLMVACFLDEDPTVGWDTLFTPLADEIGGVGEILLAAPFVATVPGTDRYCDELRT